MAKRRTARLTLALTGATQKENKEAKVILAIFGTAIRSAFKARNVSNTASFRIEIVDV